MIFRNLWLLLQEKQPNNAVISTMTIKTLMIKHCIVRSITEDIGDMVRVIKTMPTTLRELTEEDRKENLVRIHLLRAMYQRG